MRTLATIRTAFQCFGSRPDHTRMLDGETLLLHIEPAPKGLNEIRAYLDETVIWLLESLPRPDCPINIFWHGRLLAGTCLGKTDDLAEALTQLAHPEPNGNGP
jgi:hypothetical protein